SGGRSTSARASGTPSVPLSLSRTTRTRSPESRPSGTRPLTSGTPTSATVPSPIGLSSTSIEVSSSCPCESGTLAYVPRTWPIAPAGTTRSESVATFVRPRRSRVISVPAGTSWVRTSTGSRESIRSASSPARAAPPTISSTPSSVTAGRRRRGGDGREAPSPAWPVTPRSARARWRSWSASLTCPVVVRSAMESVPLADFEQCDPTRNRTLPMQAPRRNHASLARLGHHGSPGGSRLARMRLLVTAEAVSTGESRDVIVGYTPASTVRDLEPVLQEESGRRSPHADVADVIDLAARREQQPDGPGLWLGRERLDPDATLVSTSIHHGAIVGLGGPSSHR